MDDEDIISSTDMTPPMPELHPKAQGLSDPHRIQMMYNAAHNVKACTNAGKMIVNKHDENQRETYQSPTVAASAVENSHTKPNAQRGQHDLSRSLRIVSPTWRAHEGLPSALEHRSNKIAKV